MRILVSDKVEVVNGETGEVSSKITRQRFTKKVTRFQMMNIESNWHREITPTEVLLIMELAIYENHQTYHVHMDSDTRSKIAKNLKLSDATIKRLLANLLKTNYLKKVSRGVYMVNPDCVWSCSETLKQKKLDEFNEL